MPAPRISLALPVLVLTAVLPACTRSRSEPAMLDSAPRPAEMAARRDANQAAQPPGTLLAAVSAKQGTGTAASPALASAFASLKLIRSAQIAMEVARYEQAAEEVARLAESFGGYLAGAQAARAAQGRQAGTVTIRIPSDRFGAALAAFRGLGTVRNETVATQDVTKEYADLETRLHVKRDTALRLRELLRTRTADLPDVLNAERELARVTEEIEQMEGERRFYDHQVALSTITLALSEPQALMEPGMFAPIGHAFHNAAETLTHSLAGMVFLLVAGAPWFAAAYVIWRLVKAVRGRRKPAAA